MTLLCAVLKSWMHTMSDVEYYTSESMAWTQADSTQSSGDLEDSTRH